MKRSPVHIGAGNLNMHGKKTHRMDCQCCTAYDFRYDVLKREHEKEMRDTATK